MEVIVNHGNNHGSYCNCQLWNNHGILWSIMEIIMEVIVIVNRGIIMEVIVNHGNNHGSYCESKNNHESNLQS